MRKLLLATSALVAFAGAAQAAESPIAVTAGGYVDFRAALMHQNNSIVGNLSTGSDFQTEFQVNLEATGKQNGVEYGAKIGLWNGHSTYGNATANGVTEHDAYVWLSGNFGKGVFGDAHSASTDLFVGAPTVGEGQIDGSFTNFIDQSKLIVLTPAYADDDNNSTKVTYYTPKVGNANHKVQLGVSFTPNEGQGAAVKQYNSDESLYKNTTGAALQYTGKFGSVSAVASAIANIGSANNNSTTALVKDYVSYGAGAQLTYAGITVGGSYVDAGHQNEVQSTVNNGKPQDVWTFGAKYGFDKVAVAANILDGRGYISPASSFNVPISGTHQAYVRDIQELGLGATYTWFPGLTTAADAVLFQQKLDNTTTPTENGHVFMLSQKLAF